MWVESRGRVRYFGKGRVHLTMWRVSNFWAMNNCSAIECPMGLWLPVIRVMFIVLYLYTRLLQSLQRPKRVGNCFKSSFVLRRSLALTTRLHWSGLWQREEVWNSEATNPRKVPRRSCLIQSYWQSTLRWGEFTMPVCFLSLLFLQKRVCNHNALQKLPLYTYLLDKYRWENICKG